MSIENGKESPLSHENDIKEGSKHTLILFNDNHNSFDHVIESLVEVCGHDAVQAEQCVLIAHYKGSCEVKTGSLKVLKSMSVGLGKRDLTSDIKS
ncbi:MAG: ATP-dependent Clp protease adaptor ClpS [Bacteroidales bacterium]|nr:ATP-dependent Clp protease adaptor ClpS [Bacteroidales bacterium]